MSAPLAYIGLVDKRGYVRNYVPITADVVFIGERKPALVRIHHPDVHPLHLRIQWSSRDGAIKPYLRAIGPGCIFNDSVLRPTEERVLEDGTNFFLAGYHMIFSLQQTATEIRRKVGDSSSSAPIAAAIAPTTTKKTKNVESSDSVLNSTPPVALSSSTTLNPPTQRLLDQSVESDSVNVSTTSIISFAPTDLESSQTLLHSIEEPLESSSQISSSPSLPLESSQQSMPATNLESSEMERPIEKKEKKTKIYPKGQDKAHRLSLEAEYIARKIGGDSPSSERRRRATTPIYRQLTQKVVRSKEPISSAPLPAVEINVNAMDVDRLSTPSPQVNPVFVQEDVQISQVIEQKVPEEIQEDVNSDFASQQSTEISKSADIVLVEDSVEVNQMMNQEVPEKVHDEANSEFARQQPAEISKSVNPVLVEEDVQINQVIEPEAPEEVQEDAKSEYATQQSAETSKSQKALQEMLESAQYMLEKNGGLTRRTRRSLGDYSSSPSSSERTSLARRRKSVDSATYKAERPVTPKRTKKRKSVESDLSSVTDKSSGNETSSPLPVSEVSVEVSATVQEVMKENGDLNQSVDSYLERSSMDLSVAEDSTLFASQASVDGVATSSQEAAPVKKNIVSRPRSSRTAKSPSNQLPKLRARGESPVPYGQSLEEIVENLKRKKHTSQDAYQEYKHYQRLLEKQTLELEAEKQAQLNEEQRAKSSARRSNGQKARNEYVKMLISGSAKKLRPPKARSPVSGNSSPKSSSPTASASSSQQEDDAYLPYGPYAIESDSPPAPRASPSNRKSRSPAVPARLKPLLDSSISAEQKLKIEENEDPETMMRFYEEMARDNASYYMDYKSWSLKVQQEVNEAEKAKTEDAAVMTSTTRPPKSKSSIATTRAAAPKTSTARKPTPIVKRSKATAANKPQASKPQASPVLSTSSAPHPASYSHLPPIQLNATDVQTRTPTVTSQSSRQIITTTINNKVTRLSVLSTTPQEELPSKSTANLKKRPREDEAPEDNQLTPEPKKVFNFDFDLD